MEELRQLIEATFRSDNGSLLVAILHESSEDDDFADVLLWDMALRSRRPRKIRRTEQTFAMDVIDKTTAYQHFRFTKEDLPRLAAALRMPPKVTAANGTTASGMEALCITLRRLAYPNRLIDICDLFNRDYHEVSRIFNTTVDILHGLHHQRFDTLNHPWIGRPELQRMAQAVHEKGAPLDRCVGFIDGTVRPISRPTIFQNVVFNGHKRQHALKFQAVMMHNGLISHLFGPVEGRRHDVVLLRESGLVPQMCNLFWDGNQHPLYLYGDQAYPVSDHLISPFRDTNLTADQERFNAEMCKVRLCVEWGFGKILNLFAFLDYKKGLKLWQQPVGKYYLLGALMTNCHTCLYGSETSQSFGLAPPALETYLQLKLFSY